MTGGTSECYIENWAKDLKNPEEWDQEYKGTSNQGIVEAGGSCGNAQLVSGEFSGGGAIDLEEVVSERTSATFRLKLEKSDLSLKQGQFSWWKEKLNHEMAS